MRARDESTGAVFLRALVAALGRVPLWLLLSLAFMLLALPAALMTHDSVADALGRGYAPGSQLGAFDSNFWVDYAGDKSELDDAVGTVGTVAALLALLLGIFSAGGWLQVFLERTDGHSVRRFLHGSVRHFWRFARVFVLVLVGLGLIRFAVYHQPWHELVETRLLELPEVPPQGATTGPGYTSERLAELPDELTARRVQWAQDGLHALLVSLLLVWALYTRTRLALHDASSSVWAGLCTFFAMLRHPIRTLRPMLLLLLIELLVVYVAGAIHGWMEESLDAESTWKSVAMIFTLGTIVIVMSEILHAAKYHAAILVSRRIMSPITRPDPWKHSVGAPGGPQYPIVEGSDEYGVSL